MAIRRRPATSRTPAPRRVVARPPADERRRHPAPLPGYEPEYEPAFAEPLEEQAAFGERPAITPRPTVHLLQQASLVVLIIALCSTIVFLLRDSRFQIKVIEVRGNQRVPREEIVAHVPVVGLNIFFVETEPLAQELLALPRIASATVRRTLPDGLEVEVRERQPAAILRVGQVRLEMSQDGVVLGAAPPQPQPGLPVIDLPGAVPPPAGSRLDPGVLPRVRDLRQALASQLNMPDPRLDYEPDGSLLVHGPDWLANFGDDPAAAHRVATLKAMLEESQRAHLPHAYLDLRTSIPYTRPTR